MIPRVPEVLADLAGLLMRNADPAVDPADRASALGLSAMLLAVAAEYWDGAAQRLVEENRAFRALLTRAPVLPDDWTELSEEDADLRISVLQAVNARLRAALIELHADVENSQDPACQALEQAVWDELRASTERRKLAASPV